MEQMQILYEDRHMIVVHKPGGVPVQTRHFGQKDMESLLKNYRSRNGEEPFIAMPHRLDQPVEGLLLAAKTKEAAAGLSAQLQTRCVEKCYRAVVRNRAADPLLAGEEGTLSDFLLRDGKANCSKAVREGTPGAKRAVLRYRALRAAGPLLELSIVLETGRHHQIRVQMANAGMPLLGDRKYGGEAAEGQKEQVKHIALCAVKLRFFHPMTGEGMECSTEPKNPAFQLLYE